MFTFRLLTPDDFPLLHEWLHRPHVAEWWARPPTLAEVEEEFGGDIASPAIFPHVALLDGEPVGFIQWYEVMSADPESWWKDETDPGARGIDQFLANDTQLGRGLGTQMIREFVAQLFADPAVTKVQTDPDPTNTRAVRSYEKVGFRAIRELATPDGPALLMVVRREEWRGPVARIEKPVAKGSGSTPRDPSP